MRPSPERLAAAEHLIRTQFCGGKLTHFSGLACDRQFFWNALQTIAVASPDKPKLFPPTDFLEVQ
jgi:hypothetical protein